MDELHVVLTSPTTAKAELVRGALESASIQAWVEPAAIHSQDLPGSDARVLVRSEDAERAGEIARGWSGARS